MQAPVEPARYLLFANLPTAALSAAQRWLSEVPADDITQRVQALNVIKVAHLTRYEPAEALAVWDQLGPILAHCPDHDLRAKVWANRGQAFQRLGHWQEARAALEAALAQRPGDDVAGACHLSLSVVAEINDDVTAALEHSKAAMRLLQGSHGALELPARNNVGWAFFVAGDTERARPILEELLSLPEWNDDPRSAYTLTELAWLDLLQGEVRQAVQRAAEALQRLHLVVSHTDSLELARLLHAFAAIHRAANRGEEAGLLREEAFRFYRLARARVPAYHLSAEEALGRQTLPPEAERQLHAETQRLRFLLWSMRWVGELEQREPKVAGHSNRVRHYAVQLSTSLGWAGDLRRKLALGALLHDIGKLEVPREVLLKPGALTPLEFALVQEHPLRAVRMLDSLDPEPIARAVVLYHHEQMSGKGYPTGLAGARIPEPARLAAVVDVYDALTSDRVYRPAMTHEEAMQLLVQMRADHLDPTLVDAFFAMHRLPGC